MRSQEEFYRFDIPNRPHSDSAASRKEVVAMASSLLLSIDTSANETLTESRKGAVSAIVKSCLEEKDLFNWNVVAKTFQSPREVLQMNRIQRGNPSKWGPNASQAFRQTSV